VSWLVLRSIFDIAKKYEWGLRMVVQAYNPSYSRGDKRITGGGKSGQKKLVRHHLKYKPGMVVQVCNPGYLGDRSRRIMIWGWLRQETLSKNKLKSKGLGAWLECLATRRPWVQSPVPPKQEVRTEREEKQARGTMESITLLFTFLSFLWLYYRQTEDDVSPSLTLWRAGAKTGTKNPL
jgi:hypothetical protein